MIRTTRSGGELAGTPVNVAPWRGLCMRLARWMAGGLAVAAAAVTVTLIASTVGAGTGVRVLVADDSPADSAPTATLTVVPPAAPTVAPTEPRCPSAQGVDRPSTRADFEARIIKAWRLCSAPSVFATDEAGLEIRADYRWSKLSQTGDSRYVRIVGWGNEGTWETTDTSIMNGEGVWALNLHIDGSGVVVTLPKLATNVSMMRIDGGAYVADYEALPDDAVAG